ncbi:TetR/AcrR family transcriptional regulator [Microbacterium chocolatum]|uniref:TetR/AcrR family transcriptional regulator n=1 Tax=Microbacterium aurantiacum TaxID=162393 RepID=UPI00338D3E54
MSHAPEHDVDPPRRKRVARPGPAPIIAAALDAFYRVGYGAATVRDIAAGANVTVAAVYHHFDSKQDMLVNIMSRAMRDNLEAVRAQRERHDGDPRRQLRHMVGAIVEYHTGHQAEAFVGGSELRSLEEPGRSLIVTLRDEEEAEFRAVMDHGIAAGVFAVENPVLATRAILAMASAVASWYRSGGSLTLGQLQAAYGDMALRLADASPEE